MFKKGELSILYDQHQGVLSADQVSNLLARLANTSQKVSLLDHVAALSSGHPWPVATVISMNVQDQLDDRRCRQIHLPEMMGIQTIVLLIVFSDENSDGEPRFRELKEEISRYGKTAYENHDKAVDLIILPVSGPQSNEPGEIVNPISWSEKNQTADEIADALTPTDENSRPIRFLVTATKNNDRTIIGKTISGTLRPGDDIVHLPSQKTTNVVDAEIDRESGATTLNITEPAGCEPGDLMAGASEGPQSANQLRVGLVWLHEEPLYPGRTYDIQLGGQSAAATVNTLKYKTDIPSLNRLPAHKLAKLETGEGTLFLDQPIFFDDFADNPSFSFFILKDRYNADIVGYGIVRFALHRSQNITWQNVDIDKSARAQRNKQKPAVLWFTGLSGAGKSTIANLVEKRLFALGKHTYLLDGDNVRQGLNHDLGFTDADRVENIRRVSEVAKLMVDAGLIVLVSFISPFRSERRMAKDMLEENEFFEIFVDAPLEVAERRDVKGLYKKARAGKISNFTGIDSPYEKPQHPDLTLATAELNPQQAADLVIDLLHSHNLLSD